MHSSKILNDVQSDLQTIDELTEIIVFHMLTSEVERREVTTPQQGYEQVMENIWEKVDQLPEGQDKVVLSQIWECGKTTPLPTPTNFPALATYGFIVEELVAGQPVWKASTPYLKDFWRVGIHVSHANGFSLQPHHVFQANLQAQMISSGAFQDGADKRT